MGTSTKRSERFWAVTTISLISELSLAVTPSAKVLDCAYASAVIKAPVNIAATKRKCRLAVPRSRFRWLVLFEITFSSPLFSECLDDYRWKHKRILKCGPVSIPSGYHDLCRPQYGRILRLERLRSIRASKASVASVHCTSWMRTGNGFCRVDRTVPCGASCTTVWDAHRTSLY